MVILLVIVIIMFSLLLLSLILVSSSPLAVEARCPNGYHISLDGDCEIVTITGGLPRCPDGYHRSPSGDCEQVSSGETDVANGPSLKSQDDNHEDSISVTTDNNRLSSSEISLTQNSECRGEADCFRGTVTEIVDGDTMDVNEATELTESICPVGTDALVDEDDGQKEGSYDRLIGVVYCNDSTSSINQILLEQGNAVVYEDFCGVSEFARDRWITDHGC